MTARSSTPTRSSSTSPWKPLKRPRASTQYIGNKEFEGHPIRVDAGDAPTLDFLQPGLVASFVRQARLSILDLIPPSGWPGQYNESWLDMAVMPSPDGDQSAGVWHRFNGKSLVWYPVDDFEAAGYEVPTTWDEMTPCPT